MSLACPPTWDALPASVFLDEHLGGPSRVWVGVTFPAIARGSDPSQQEPPKDAGPAQCFGPASPGAGLSPVDAVNAEHRSEVAPTDPPTVSSCDPFESHQ